MSDTREVCLPIIEATFLAFGFRPNVVGETPDTISLAVAHVGWVGQRMTLWAALDHDIQSTTRGAYRVQKQDITTADARLVVARKETV